MGTQHHERVSAICLTGRSGIIFHSILYSIHYLACDFVPFHAFPTTRFMTQPAFHNLYTKTFLLPCPANHSLPCLLQLYLQLRWLETKQVLGACCVCQLPACLRKLWWLGLRYCTLYPTGCVIDFFWFAAPPFYIFLHQASRPSMIQVPWLRLDKFVTSSCLSILAQFVSFPFLLQGADLDPLTIVKIAHCPDGSQAWHSSHT